MRGIYAICLGLAVGLFCFALAQAEEPPVTFPEGWQVSEGKQNNIIFWTADAEAGDNFEATITVVRNEYDSYEKPSLSDELDEALRGFKQGFVDRAIKTSVTCGEKNNLMVGKAQAMSINCDASDVGKVVLVSTQGAKTIFLLTFFTMNQAMYDKHLPEWQAVLKSVKIQ